MLRSPTDLTDPVDETTVTETTDVLREETALLVVTVTVRPEEMQRRAISNVNA